MGSLNQEKKFFTKKDQLVSALELIRHNRSFHDVEFVTDSSSSSSGVLDSSNGAGSNNFSVCSEIVRAFSPKLFALIENAKKKTMESLESSNQRYFYLG